MKRLILVVTAVLVLVLGIISCTPAYQSDTDTPITTPEPEPEETPLDMHWIAYRTGVLSSELMDFRDKYIVNSFNGELMFQIPVALAIPYTQKLPSYLTHFSIADIESARPHIANAESLSTRGCLPTEQVSREVSPEEIVHELEASMSLLQKKVEDTYIQQSRIIVFVEDFNNWWIQEYGASHSWFQLSKEQEETYNTRYIEFFEEYREDLSKLISEHELILSKLY